MISHVTRFLDFNDNKFFSVPKPHNNELLSSWLTRIAIQHQTLPWTFYNLHFRELHNLVFARDIDVWAKKDFIDKLSFKSNISHTDIFNMTLQSYQGALCHMLTDKTRNIFVTSIKNRARQNRLFGQRFCPICFREKSTTYYKKEWRLAFVTKCQAHNIDLLDRCEMCLKPISLYKFNRNWHGFDRCWNCGFILANCSTKQANTNDQTCFLLNIIDSRFINICKTKVSSMDYFIILRQVARIVNKIDSRFKPFCLDNIPIEELSKFIALITDFCNNLDFYINNWLEDGQITKSDITKDLNYIPQLLSDLCK